MFFGWRIVAVAFLTNFVSVGFVFYSYGVFFKALTDELDSSRMGVSVGLTSVQVVSAAAAPYVGRLLDRGAARGVMTCGAVLLGLSFIVAAHVESLLQFYLVMGLGMGVGVCMLGGLASSTLVAGWFVHRRGTALGLATMGISFSGVVMPPVATALIAAVGFRSTLLVYAALALCVLAPAVWAFVINLPEDVGQAPDGHRHVDPAPRPAHTLPLASLLADGNFWIIAGVMGLNVCALSAVLTHAVPYVTDLGYNPTAAAFVLSVMAGAGALGKPAFGTISDRMDKRQAVWLASGLQALGLALMYSSAHYPALLIAAGVFGLGMGGVVPLQGALVGAVFGRYAFGRVMGALVPAMLPLSMLGAPFAGAVFDRTGHYDLAFKVFVGLFLLSMLLLRRLRLPLAEPHASAPPPPAVDTGATAA